MADFVPVKACLMKLFAFKVCKMIVCAPHDDQDPQNPPGFTSTS